MSDRALTEEEFLAWRDHPATRAIIHILGKKRDTLRRMWEGGSFGSYSLEETALVNVGNLGTCRGYAFVEELTYEQYISEISDEE